MVVQRAGGGGMPDPEGIWAFVEQKTPDNSGITDAPGINQFVPDTSGGPQPNVPDIDVRQEAEESLRQSLVSKAIFIIVVLAVIISWD